MKIQYIEKNLSLDKLKIIKIANKIIDDYRKQGFDLTLRQLYYQFVARDLMANTVNEYKRLGNVVNDGRLLGLIDWNSIVDRTRNLQKNNHWNSPDEIIEACIDSYAIDKWSWQDNRVEVWIEKDALVGVISQICSRLDVPYFSCRGYTSQSEMWRASRRFKKYDDKNQAPIIIHLGDHDPSGIDMSRDIKERINDVFQVNTHVHRIALNMNQVEKYNPPPNPAKLTDTRARHYINLHGNESWELDALEPTVLEKLISKTVKKYRCESQWDIACEIESEHIEDLKSKLSEDE